MAYLWTRGDNMSRNFNQDYFKVAGHATEDRDGASASIAQLGQKQAAKIGADGGSKLRCGSSSPTYGDVPHERRFAAVDQEAAGRAPALRTGG